jgi:SAM-dependent methyltransferase
MSTPFGHIGVLILSERPRPELIHLVDSLCQRNFARVVVVDDGWGTEFSEISRALERETDVVVVRHIIPMGKGSAFRAGVNDIAVHCPECEAVVSVDADKAYTLDDVLEVAQGIDQHRDALVLGVRESPADSPFWERFSDSLTRTVQRFILRRELTDSQSGLRGFHGRLAPLLMSLSASGYDYEIDMLVEMRQRGIPIRELTLSSHGEVYEERFRPVLDSLRAVFVFLRFFFASLATAGIDFLVFTIFYLATRNILLSTILARLVAGTFNYIVCRNVVFLSKRSIAKSLIEYVLLVAAMGTVSYSVLTAGVVFLGANVFVMKALVEALLFLANFSIQQSLIFPKPERIQYERRQTDWTHYHENPEVPARLTRRITASRLLNLLSLAEGGTTGSRIIEIGGGNSCFFPAIRERCQPSYYAIIDNNLTGIAKFRERFPEAVASGEVTLHQCDVRELGAGWDDPADICFSVGIIEHFTEDELRQVIEAHFDLVRDGGLVVISFPTPTWLYRAARKMAEAIGKWPFPDETPLKTEAVEQQMGKHGVILRRDLVWPIIFTQCIVAATKTRVGADTPEKARNGNTQGSSEPRSA